MADILRLSWEEFNHFVEILGENIQRSQKKYDCIMGIPRGGMVPAVMLSHILSIPLRPTSAIVEYDFTKDHRALLVDDIADTGGTLKRFPKYIDTATVVCRITLKERPNYFATEAEANQWIMFPYEIATEDRISKINYKDRINE